MTLAPNTSAPSPKLSELDDPDQQMPMPFEAAKVYARQVMAWSREPLSADVVATLDVPYGSHRLHRYDVFAPKAAKSAPVLIFWHGGGWTNGYRAYGHFLARHVAALNCVLVTPSYRLVSEARFPAAYDDCVAALAHVRLNIAALGGAPGRIYLSGHSAGGHLAALVALRSGLQVSGCLPISGIMDLHHDNPPPGSLEERVYTMVLAEPAQDFLMSPINHTQGKQVPFSLTVGEFDSERVRRSNLRIHELLQRQNVSVALCTTPGEDHFRTHTALRDATHPWYDRLRRMVQVGD